MPTPSPSRTGPSVDPTLDRQFLTLAAGFLLIGAAVVAVGPILPWLQRRWGASIADVSWLFVVQFASGAVGSWISTYHLRLALLAGYAAISIGLLWLVVAGFVAGFFAIGLLGLGLGLAMPGTNLVVASRNPGQRAAALARINFIWGVGAMGFPLALTFTEGLIPQGHMILGLGLLAGCMLLPLWRLQDLPVRTPVSTQPSDPAAGVVLPLLPFALILFCYVGAEATFGAWLVSIGLAVEGTSPRTALLIGSSFWAALLLGRALTSRCLRVVTERRLFVLSLTLSIAGTFSVMVSISPVWLLLSSFFAGLGLASVYPLTVSMLTERAERIGTSNTGWVFIATGLGGSVMPWVTGQVAAWAPHERLGFVAPLVALLTILCLFPTRFFRHQAP